MTEASRSDREPNLAPEMHCIPFQPVERIDIALLERFWPEFYKKNIPVIVTGGADDWPAMSKWTPLFFADLLEGMDLPLRRSDNEVEYTFVNHTKRQLNVSEHLRGLEVDAPSNERPYFGNIPIAAPHIARWFDAIRMDFKFPDVALDRIGDEIRLWIGAKGQKSTIHNDSNHNFNAQVYGRKYFILFPPEQHPCMYAKKICDETWVSPIDWEKPDFERFPKYAQARGQEVTLEVGDMLYIPAFWWHAARAESTAININDWIFTPDIGKWIQ